MLMFGWDFEVDACSRFWRWNSIKICVRTYNMNSTLGSVVPLAMFYSSTVLRSSGRLGGLLGETWLGVRLRRALRDLRHRRYLHFWNCWRRQPAFHAAASGVHGDYQEFFFIFVLCCKFLIYILPGEYQHLLCCVPLLLLLRAEEQEESRGVWCWTGHCRQE